MKVGVPFYISTEYEDADRLIPVTFTCASCGKLIRANFIEDFFSEVIGRRLECFDCTPQWIDVMTALGSDARDNRRRVLYAFMLIHELPR